MSTMSKSCAPKPTLLGEKQYQKDSHHFIKKCENSDSQFWNLLLDQVGKMLNYDLLTKSCYINLKSMCDMTFEVGIHVKKV